MRRIPFATLTLLAAAPLSLAGQAIVGRNDRSLTLSEAVSAGGWVRVATFNGRIDITQGGGGKVELRAVKEVRRGDIEDVGFVVRREEGGVTVCAVYDAADECNSDGSYHGPHRSGDWSRRHQSSVDFTLQIPAGVRVRAGSGNGDVSIAVAGAEVIAASGNGRVTVQDARGPVDASSGNGAIRVVTSSGPVSASSGNGEIDVSIGKLDRSADMEFSTGNGQVTLRLPENYGAELQASTGNGTVSSDFPVTIRSGRLDHSRLRGTLGGGGGRLTISSGNGNVEIRKQP